jgi:hypothetical protein
MKQPGGLDLKRRLRPLYPAAGARPRARRRNHSDLCPLFVAAAVFVTIASLIILFDHPRDLRSSAKIQSVSNAGPGKAP